MMVVIARAVHAIDASRRLSVTKHATDRTLLTRFLLESTG